MTEEQTTGELPDDQPRNGESHDGQRSNGELANGESTNGTPDDRTPIDGVLVSDGRESSIPDDPFGTDGAVDDDGEIHPTDDTVESDDTDAAAENGAALPNDVDVPASADDEVEPVELLVQLAKDGEIEPWDIDIVEVTDAFLSRLDATDLRTTGRALFYASVLLRMKSDELLAPEEPDEPEPEPWEVAMEGGGDPDFDPVVALEAEMDRRLERKHARGSPETLDELVRELREAERGSWWKRSRTYDTSSSPQGYRRGTQTLDYRAGDDFRVDGEPGEDAVTGTAHKEDIEAVIDDVRAVLREQYERGRSEVLFREFRDAGGSTMMTYLALLFLAHRGEVRLQQDDLFGDLWVRDAATTRVEGDAVGVAD